MGTYLAHNTVSRKRAILRDVRGADAYRGDARWTRLKKGGQRVVTSAS